MVSIGVGGMKSIDLSDDILIKFCYRARKALRMLLYFIFLKHAFKNKIVVKPKIICVFIIKGTIFIMKIVAQLCVAASIHFIICITKLNFFQTWLNCLFSIPHPPCKSRTKFYIFLLSLWQNVFQKSNVPIFSCL